MPGVQSRDARASQSTPAGRYVPAVEPRHQDVALRGVVHRVTFWGAPSDDPVLLLHGFLDDGATFQFLVDALPRELSFAALDWRGFGASAWNGAPYWFPDYFADLEAWLDVLELRRPPRVVGHSMGGNIALLYAGIRPQACRAVVSLEGFGLPRVEPAAAPARYAQWLDQLREPAKRSRFESVEALAAVLQRRNPRLRADRARFIAQAWTRTAAAGGVELRSDPAHRFVNPILYRRDEADACWSRVRCPVLMVLGELSEYLPRLGPEGEEGHWRALVPQIRFARLPRVGHMLHHEEPESVAAAIGPFLADQA